MAMARRGDPESGSYDQARKLRRGRQLWTGDGWAAVRSVRVSGEHVLITVADGRVFRTSYLDAVLSRKTPPATLATGRRTVISVPSLRSLPTLPDLLFLRLLLPR
jgi:hypothetical protein